MRADGDRTAPTIPEIAEAVVRASAGRRIAVLVDGRSGAGKTTLARRLAALLEAQLVSLDDVYPGWDGLERGSRQVAESILAERMPGWRGWDWTAERIAAWHPLDARRPIVVEGCGALTRASRRRATFAIWLELDALTRRARALARDGETYAPHWDRWAAQEDALLRRERPGSLADLRLAGGQPARQAQPRRCNSASSMP